MVGHPSSQYILVEPNAGFLLFVQLPVGSVDRVLPFVLDSRKIVDAEHGFGLGKYQQAGCRVELAARVLEVIRDLLQRHAKNGNRNREVLRDQIEHLGA